MSTRPKKCLIGALAWCRDCEWSDEYAFTAQKSSRKHFKETGHDIDVELVYQYLYTNKKGV